MVDLSCRLRSNRYIYTERLFATYTIITNVETNIIDFIIKVVLHYWRNITKECLYIAVSLIIRDLLIKKCNIDLYSVNSAQNTCNVLVK